MSNEQFTVIMPYICNDLIGMIASRQEIDEEQALRKLYSSKLYTFLEDEESKVWQYSTHMLYELLKQEEETGKISFPDV